MNNSRVRSFRPLDRRAASAGRRLALALLMLLPISVRPGQRQPVSLWKIRQFASSLNRDRRLVISRCETTPGLPSISPEHHRVPAAW